MKAIVKAVAGPGFKIMDVPEPKPGHGEVKIKISKTGICGTDLHIYNWDAWSQSRIKPPVIGGHEFVGRVVELGAGVDFIEIGSRVSAEGHIVCGHCQFCRTGLAHVCEKTKIIGVDTDGCFAEYLVMPADNLWPVTDEIPDKYASIFDPLGNAMHTIVAGEISGRSVLINGAGAIGLFAVPLALGSGAAKVIVIEPNEYRAEIARRVGSALVLHPADADLKKKIMQATHRLGPEVVLEMSGHPGGIKTAFELIRNGGDFVMLGIPSAPIDLNWARDVIFKGIRIHGVSGRRLYDTWYRCQAFLETDHHRLDPVLTHELEYVEFEKGLELMKSGVSGKVILDFPD